MTPSSKKRYIVYDYNMCDAFYGSKHSEDVEYSYESYDAVGTKTTACTRVGCTYSSTGEAKALFTYIGRSVPENGADGIAIGYIINDIAISEYESATGKKITYGVFAVLKTRLGDNEIFNGEGVAANGVIYAEMSVYDFTAFELKIVGFKTDEQKNAQIAMGAYVLETAGEVSEYSYLQLGTPKEIEKYYFASYNDIITAAN